MNKIAGLLILMFPLFVAAQNKLDFFAENIDFEITGSDFSVNGVYYFANLSDRDIKPDIYFPFAPNADSLKMKQVYDLLGNQKINCRFSGNGITFPVFIPANVALAVLLAYSQKTAKENVYILKSTQTWGKPLTTANYSLKVNNGISVDSFSYEPDRISEDIYLWEKKEFMPDKDFIIFIE